jgi:hypothetical protein
MCYKGSLAVPRSVLHTGWQVDPRRYIESSESLSRPHNSSFTLVIFKIHIPTAVHFTIPLLWKLSLAATLRNDFPATLRNFINFLQLGNVNFSI